MIQNTSYYNNIMSSYYTKLSLQPRIKPWYLYKTSPSTITKLNHTSCLLWLIHNFPFQSALTLIHKLAPLIHSLERGIVTNFMIHNRTGCCEHLNTLSLRTSFILYDLELDIPSGGFLTFSNTCLIR